MLKALVFAVVGGGLTFSSMKIPYEKKSGSVNTFIHQRMTCMIFG